ncbi:hypothetical protein GcM1_219052 [Golovinomyces cichoracearum]|uniref:Uncharacterized protein n=1 Tax=Golovinomyces cichoracearum TaxID=62708 RepID=A0A420ISD8_9PEZI|nr:hypothetical protein GcM1_219052 [Golovinomyces cichoracearum]
MALKRMTLYSGVFFAFAIFIFMHPNIASNKLLSEDYDISKYQAKSSSVLNPFRQPIIAHHPPIQKKNSTHGENYWYSNWNHFNPFSSWVKIDENQIRLPPLRNRAPIYTYYEFTTAKEEEEAAATNTDQANAEDALLLTWSRAWWAQGFKPIILGPADAMNSPLAVELQFKDLGGTLKNQIFRWLAWENMGTGILCDYLLFPMAAHDDPLLEFLRRGEYPRLTRFENLASGLFVGSKADITAALKQALSNEDLESAKDFISAVIPNTFLIDPNHAALAYYDRKIITEKYPKLEDKINSQDSKSLMVLNQLILAHLQSTWQNIFHKGIAVLKPLPNHMTVLIEPAMTLASFLSNCPDSPLPASCPPNFPKCKPCVASQPLKISTPSVYKNTSSLYTIGTVLHPHTNAILASTGKDIDISWIRRISERDSWIIALTKDLLGTGMSGLSRMSKFKEAVASEISSGSSLWLLAENPLPEDLDWYFGFTISKSETSDGKSETPVPGPERRPKKKSDPSDGPVATESELELERELVKRVYKLREGMSDEQSLIRKAIEAWNLADTEAWRFVKAFMAQIKDEKLKWEDEEKNQAADRWAKNSPHKN